MNEYILNIIKTMYSAIEHPVNIALYKCCILLLLLVVVVFGIQNERMPLLQCRAYVTWNRGLADIRNPSEPGCAIRSFASGSSTAKMALKLIPRKLLTSVLGAPRS